MAFRAKFLHFKTKASYQAERTRQENAGTVNDFDKYISFVDEGPTLYTWKKEYSGAEIEDVLTSTSADKSLSANMGRVLNESIDLRNVAAVNSGNVIDTEAIPTVQPKLTVEVKDNGNIVLGNLEGETKEFMPATPSGDPMHYAYLQAGAVWNASTGYWELNGLTDITNEQMLAIYNLGSINNLDWAPLSGNQAKVRTNLLRQGLSNTDFRATVSFNYLAYENNIIEVINLKNSTGVYISMVTTSSLSKAFYGCQKLTTIHGRLYNQSSNGYSDTFYNCVSLTNVNIWKLFCNISFAHSPLLSKESLLYMINNCSTSKTFTITLHADVYAKCVEGGEWYSDVSTALASALSDKTTTITLASA